MYIVRREIEENALKDKVREASRLVHVEVRVSRLDRKEEQGNKVLRESRNI